MGQDPRKSKAAGDYLGLDDQALLAQCNVQIHRSSGPGGQHRNKVSTACRLHHAPTGVSAQAYDSRSQRENRVKALKRLRGKIACQVRRPVDPDKPAVPEVVASCVFRPKNGAAGAPRQLRVGRKDARFWQVGQFLLDLLDACGGRLAPVAGALGISTSNLSSVMRQDRHILAAAQAIRKQHGMGPIK
jgi:hypothetical protein